MAPEPIALQRPSWRNEYLALLCGIANAGGGILTLTSPDDKSGKGIQQIRKSFESIPELTQEKLGIACTTEPVMMGGVICLEISIPPAREPVSYEDTYYLYEDGQNSTQSRERVAQVISSMHNVPWELRVQPDVTLETAEPYMVARFAEGISGAQDGTAIDGDSAEFDPDNEAALASARLKDARSRCLTNAGTLLLSRTPDEHIPGAYVRIDLFDDDDYSILQQEEVKGTLLSQLETTVDLVFERFLPRLSKNGKMSPPPVHRDIRSHPQRSRA